MSDTQGQPPAPDEDPAGPASGGSTPAVPPTPYGQVPQQGGPSPFGVPPGGDPSYGPVPYGHSPYHHNPYGQPPLGMPGYGAPLRDPNARPATVLAAAVITFIMAGLVALVLAVFTLLLVVAPVEFIDGFRSEGGLQDVGEDDGWFLGILVVLVLLLLWCVAAIVLAAFALRRSNAARIGLVVSSGLAGLVSLVTIMGGVPVVTLAAAIAVVVCLFTGGANGWYRQHEGVPGAPPY